MHRNQALGASLAGPSHTYAQAQAQAQCVQDVSCGEKMTPEQETHLGSLHGKASMALKRAYGIRDNLEAFAHRVGVGMPPATPEGSAGATASVTVTHALHDGADELHRVLGAIEDIAGALRQHA